MWKKSFSDETLAKTLQIVVNEYLLPRWQDSYYIEEIGHVEDTANLQVYIEKR